MAPAWRARRAHSVQPGVVLVDLVGRAVDDHEQARTHVTHLRDRAALLPEVLADGQGDVDAVQPDDAGFTAGHEVAELVEHAVVRQMVLRVAGHDLPAVQDRGRVDRRPAWRAEPGSPSALQQVEVPDDHAQLSHALLGKDLRHRVQRRDRRLLERLAQRQVLHGISGEHHLREGDQVRPGLLRLAGEAQDEVGVAREVPHRGVHLTQSDPQLRHAPQATDRSRSRPVEPRPQFRQPPRTGPRCATLTG